MSWLLIVLGLTNASGPWYLFWSGFYGALSLFVVSMTLLRKFNCHWPKCWYIAWQPHPNGTGVMLCRKHLPIARSQWHRHVITHSRIRGVNYSRNCSYGVRKNSIVMSAKYSERDSNPHPSA